MISLLNPTDSSIKAITKKEACSILNISYSTVRLDRIIEEFREQKEYRARRVAQNRGRSARPDEIKEVITDYLSGENISSISKGLYRSNSFVKNILEKVGVPQRPVNVEDRKAPMYLPEACVSTEFAEGEIVWSATNHAPAQVVKRYTKEYQDSKPGVVTEDYNDRYSSDCYSIYVRQKPGGDLEDFYSSAGIAGFYSYALAYDLGKLSHLEEYGIDLTKL